jgi:hypothetical protein
MKKAVKEIGVLILGVFLVESFVVSLVTMEVILDTLDVWSWNGLSKSMFLASYTVGILSIVTHVIMLVKNYKKILTWLS